MENQNGNIKIEEFINVKDKIKELDLDVSSPLIVLPKNFEDVKSVEDIDYDFEETLVIHKMLNLDYKSNLLVDAKDKVRFSEVELLKIVLYVTHTFVLPIILGIIANRLDGYLKNKNFNLRLIFDSRGDSNSIVFDGNVSDLKEAENSIIKISNEISGLEPLEAIKMAKELLDCEAITEEQFEIIREKYLEVLKQNP